MMKIAAFVVLAACHDASVAPPPLSPERIAANAPALEALRGAKFPDAVKLAGEQLAVAPRDSEAAAIRGLAAYVTAADRLVVDTDAGHSWFIVDALLDDHAHPALETFIAKIDGVDRDLAIAAADPHFSLELCVACWEYDWNHRGDIDDRDRKLLEVEVDAQGKELPEGDPRRRPTFRFDRVHNSNRGHGVSSRPGGNGPPAALSSNRTSRFTEPLTFEEPCFRA